MNNARLWIARLALLLLTWPALATASPSWPPTELSRLSPERRAELEPIFNEHVRIAAEFAATLEAPDPDTAFGNLVRKYRDFLDAPYPEELTTAQADRVSALWNLSSPQSDNNAEVLSWIDPIARATVRSAKTYAIRGYFRLYTGDLAGARADARLARLLLIHRLAQDNDDGLTFRLEATLRLPAQVRDVPQLPVSPYNVTRARAGLANPDDAADFDTLHHSNTNLGRQLAAARAGSDPTAVGAILIDVLIAHGFNTGRVPLPTVSFEARKAHLETAERQMAAGEYAAALESLAAAELLGAHPAIFTARGTCLARLERPAEALAEFSTAAYLDRNDDRAAEGVKTTQRRLAEIAAAHFTATRENAAARFAAGDATAAGAILEEARTTAPRSLPLRLLQIDFLQATGQGAAAEQALADIGKQHPGEPDVLARLALPEFARRNFDGALAILARRSSSTPPTADWSAAWIVAGGFSALSSSRPDANGAQAILAGIMAKLNDPAAYPGITLSPLALTLHAQVAGMAGKRELAVIQMDSFTRHAPFVPAQLHQQLEQNLRQMAANPASDDAARERYTQLADQHLAAIARMTGADTR